MISVNIGILCYVGHLEICIMLLLVLGVALVSYEL